MKHIRQYPTQAELQAIFDYKEDGTLVRKKGLRKVGSFSKSVGYYHVELQGADYLLHRLIYIHQKGAIPTGLVIDHIDGDVINNRIENLQAITLERNNHKGNRKPRSISGYLGVKFEGKGYSAGISLDSQQIFLGYFSTVIEAANAYDEACYMLRGPRFAKTNFPIERFYSEYFPEGYSE